MGHVWICPIPIPNTIPLFLILLEQVLRGVINMLHAEVEKREEKRVIRLHVAYAQ
jgi:hypothetical protein